MQRCATDDDRPPSRSDSQNEPIQRDASQNNLNQQENSTTLNQDVPSTEPEITVCDRKDKLEYNFAKRMSCKWSTGAGPRIGCVREYPTELQTRALEQVNLSPRLPNGGLSNYGPIPSPRPSPKLRLSPRVSYMGLPSPRTPIAAAN